MQQPYILRLVYVQRKNSSIFFLFISLVFHLLVYGLFKGFHSFSDEAYSKGIRSISVTLLPEESTVLKTAVNTSLISPIKLNERKKIIDTDPKDLVPSVLTKTVSSIDRVSPSVTVSTERELALNAKVLIEQSYHVTKEVAKEMESLVKSTDIFDQRFREKLEIARRKDIAESRLRKPSTEQSITYNRMGDVVTEVGGRCFVTPGVFYFDTFKPLNSIIALPDPSCNKSDNLSLDLSKL